VLRQLFQLLTKHKAMFKDIYILYNADEPDTLEIIRYFELLS